MIRILIPQGAIDRDAGRDPTARLAHTDGLGGWKSTSAVGAGWDHGTPPPSFPYHVIVPSARSHTDHKYFIHKNRVCPRRPTCKSAVKKSIIFISSREEKKKKSGSTRTTVVKGIVVIHVL